MKDNTKVRVSNIPACDYCGEQEITFHHRNTKVEAKYDAMSHSGHWAYMCEQHFQQHGVGLGLGKGQELIPVV